ncbi:MAG: hypothetical protein COB60_01995 [Flavobacteriaceae bacterium]|nr:MAG: hypothetical protein COB60_01995 [Flavobacteriaceae bacterium]
MREKKNIDRLFQEKLKDFEVFPPNKSWLLIEKNIVETPKKRRLPLWIRITSIAAMLLVFITLGNKYIAPNELSGLQQFIFKTKDSIKGIVQTEKKENEVITSKKEEIKAVQSSKTTTINTSNNIPETTLNNVSVTEIKPQEKTQKSFLLKDGENLPLKNDRSFPKEEKEKRWSIAYNVAPIYFSSFGSSTSPIDNQFENNSTSGKSNFSHGIKIAFKLNNKFSVQSGVNLVDMGYTTNNVYFPTGVTAVSLADISGMPVNSLAKNASSEKSLSRQSSITERNTGSIDQIFGYVEIPLEIKYQLTNGKLGLNIVGGFSTLFLNKNELLIEADGFRTSIGEASNLRDINFSGNIGVDVDYLIHKNLYINVSPMLKVQTNTFSKSTGDFQPYYLGIYTGLNFKF